MKNNNNLKIFGYSHITKIIFIILLAIFFSYSLFLALRLNTGIIPDEPAHFTFSKHFSSTLGIPPDTYETYSWGWYIEQNPFLYYWITGRIINVIELLIPSANDWQILVTLRVANVFFSLGTVVFCFHLSRELIRDLWWQLIPVLLLTNTLMFVFLSGGVNYDNLANFFSIAGIYYLIRALKRKNFVINSLLWIIFIGLGTLVKYTILPLALAMSFAWLFLMIKFRRSIFPVDFKIHEIILTCLLLIILAGNFALYGINLIHYQSLTPPCREILLESQCEISPYEQRNQSIANNPKLSIKESMDLGFPSPIRYAFIDWVYHMLMRSYGMIGHQSYFPLDLIIYYLILFYSMLVLGIFNLIYKGRISYVNVSLVWIVFFYAVVLLIRNYNTELIYDFMQISFQGRYIFPVIGAIYVLFVIVLKATPHWVLRSFLVFLVISLFIIGGPLTILRGYNSFLIGWFY